jgi:hypothetical protein
VAGPAWAAIVKIWEGDTPGDEQTCKQTTHGIASRQRGYSTGCNEARVQQPCCWPHLHERLKCTGGQQGSQLQHIGRQGEPQI